MNKIIDALEAVPWPYRFLIILGLLYISATLASYRMYKKQELKIAKLEKQSFFEKYVTMTIENLKNNTKRIDGWFEYIKKSPQSAFQELRKIIFNEIFLTFVPAPLSTIEKSMGDTFPKILQFLKDSKPHREDNIKAQYNVIQQQINDIRKAFPEDSNLLSEQIDPLLIHQGKMLKLKNDMKKLVDDLQDCIEITKEEKG